MRKLALVHVSLDADDLVAEARAIFPETLVARDFLSLEVGEAG